MPRNAKSFADADEEFTFKEQDAKETDKRSAPKNLEVVRGQDGLYRVAWTAGGEVPDLLKGRWTTTARALEAINAYEANKD